MHVSDVVAALSADSDGSESSGGSTTPTEVLEEVEMAARERDGVEGRWGDVIGLEVRGGGGDGEHGVGVAGRAGLLRGDVPGVEAAGVGLDEGDLDDVGEAPAAAVGSETAGSGCMDGQDDEVEAVVENQIYTMPGSWPEDDK